MGSSSWPLTEVQVIASVNVDELVTVDVDASREGKAPHRLQQHGEMCVGQIANGCARGRCGKRQLLENGVVPSRR